MRVRIGLDTGEPVVSGDGYVGLSIHRAARICAAGHGGQIVVSGATHELLEHDLDGRGSFRDLGRRQLKDFDRPERLYQVTGHDLPDDFPPLRAPAAARASTRVRLAGAAALVVLVAGVAVFALIDPGESDFAGRRTTSEQMRLA